MRFLVVNYRYFVSGGPERYLFNLKSLLEESGHSVVPFSVKNNRNENSPCDRYFLSPLGTGDQTYFDDLKRSVGTTLKLMDRAGYSWEARIKMRKLIQSETPDVAYLLHFLRWISPSIIPVLKGHGIPILVRLSDYSYVCPQSHLLRDGQGCDLCVTGNLLHSVKYRCVHGSRVLSAANMLSLYLYRAMNIWSSVDYFVCPSQFLLTKMMEGGFPRSKLLFIPTFVDCNFFRPNPSPGEYILYFGRVSPEKGVDTLLKAFEIMKSKGAYRTLRLVIVGISRPGDPEKLKAMISPQVASDVDFVPEKGLDDLSTIVGRSLCSVVPSRAGENLPNSVLESFACAKPVVASNIGSLSEVVQHEETGLLFAQGNADDLASQLSRLVSNRPFVEALGRNARRRAEQYYSPARHLASLFEAIRLVRSKPG